jgi:serine/threonine-protein kinase
VQVLDYGIEDGLPYLVMELLVGEDLGKRLHRERRLMPAALSRILMQAARGLRTAHEAGVVHRDLKPANLFLARVDDEEIVKILDFGIAKGTQAEPLGDATKTGSLMGSPHYMSPEQVRGMRDIDPRSDVWSLAVIAFRALTGRLPFPGNAVGEVIAQILADPIPIASRIAPDLPPEVDGFFARGFARDRTQRFQTARELAEAFAAVAQVAASHLGGRPLLPTLPLGAAGELATPPPTPSFQSMNVLGSFGPASTSAPPLDLATPAPTGSLAAATMGGPTVGPVTQTTHPPARTPKAWWGFAAAGGALVGVLCGVGAFALSRPTDAPVPAAGGEAPAAPQPTVQPAVTAADPPSLTVEPEVTKPESAKSASETPPRTGSPVGAPTPPATGKPGPVQAAKPAPPKPPPGPQKKKPNWGF